MRLLQINDNEIINVEMIEVISGDKDERWCWVRLHGEGFGRFCDKYSVQQLMSKICEEVYYESTRILKND